MRCKCDYITFDQLEICPKCKKDISKISKALSGVTFKAQIPDFLLLDGDESEPDVNEVETDLDAYDEEVEAEAPFADDIDLEEDDEEIDFSSDHEEDDAEEGIEFDLSHDDSEEAADAGIELAVDDDSGDDDGGLDLSLDGDEDDDGGLDLSLDGDEDDDGGLDLSLDGDEDDDGGLDLSLDGDGDDGALDLALDNGSDDLDLSLDMESGNRKGVGDLSGLDGLDIPDLSSSGGGEGDLTLESDPGSSALDDDLPDLEMSGLDTQEFVPPPDGMEAKKKLSPGAKTGTALDDFDIDLGDLGDLG
ncbi:MAG: hypothetical protein WGN25_20440 [Candidatus Electrothrix sp. GW3-4]|uniref:hypothetical protein n=1 Tax=Candidatus Electrothrix sp. GW3-4 TaxID=3126740 RepID=UPI0030D37CC2